MKNFINKNRAKILLFLILVIQTIIFITCVLNYNKLEIQDNELLYQNIKNDYNSPLYYSLTNSIKNLTNGEANTIIIGIIINIIMHVFITIITYLILNKLLKNKGKYKKENASLISLVSSITIASITNVINADMYVILTLIILFATYLHMKLKEDTGKINYKLFILILITSILGYLTSYYYIFYIATLFIIFLIRYIRKKEFKNLLLYTLTFIILVGISLIIYPKSMQLILNVFSNIMNFKSIFSNIGEYLLKLNYFGFNNTLYLILIIILVLWLSKKYCDHKIKDKNEYLKIIYIPAIVYFIVSSIGDLNVNIIHIIPVCIFTFIIVMYYLYKLLHELLTEKLANIALIIVMILVLISPFIFKIEPKIIDNKSEIVKEIENNFNEYKI